MFIIMRQQRPPYNKAQSPKVIQEGKTKTKHDFKIENYCVTKTI